MMLCNQPRRLATQLISHHASIFLGVIILGMSKPRPWKCPWTSSKKQNWEANQKMKIQQWTNKRKLAESWRYGYLGSSLQKMESRVLIDKGAVMRIHVLSGWLASSYPIRRAFLQRIGLPFRIKEKLDCCMDVCSSYRVRYGSDIIWTWKAFLSIKNYFYQRQNIAIFIKGESETCPDFWNRHNNFLSKVYRFIWRCRVFFYYWTCFPRLTALVCFLAVVPFVIFRICSNSFKKKTSSQKYSLRIERMRNTKALVKRRVIVNDSWFSPNYYQPSPTIIHMVKRQKKFVIVDDSSPAVA